MHIPVLVLSDLIPDKEFVLSDKARVAEPWNILLSSPLSTAVIVIGKFCERVRVLGVNDIE